jgi:hypothetical protein
VRAATKATTGTQEDWCVPDYGKRNEGEMNLKKTRRTRKKKSTALVISRDRKQFWTTQRQFWQWVREGTVVKIGDHPLTGVFQREHEELMVLMSHTVLNLAHPHHLREALWSRRKGLFGR